MARDNRPNVPETPDEPGSSSPLFFIKLLQSFIEFIRKILPFFPAEDM